MDIRNYNITYNLDGGTTNNPSTYTVESTITLTEPTKPGYTFIGWTGSNGSVPEKNVKIERGTIGQKEYTANWSISNTLREILINNQYTVNGSYVIGFTLGVSITQIKNKLGNDIVIDSSSSIISTGTVIKKGNESYTVVIKGDLTGDGKINSGDLLQMRKYLLEEISLNGAYKEAGIIESVNEIKSLDLLRLRQYLLGEYIFN